MFSGIRNRTEVLSEVVFLGKLVERVEAGKVQVPRFQRPFVWKQSDLHALLDSVLRGFPIGSILVWDTEKTIETSHSIGPVKVTAHPTGMVSYLLDGQQRLSTLVGTLRLPDGAESIVDQVDWCVYCDLDSREFIRTPGSGVEPQHFPVRSLLNTAGFFSACRRIESDVDDKNVAQRWLDEADRLASAFRDYQLPVIHIQEAEIDSAVTVFARLSRKGRKMAADEMVSALTYREGQFHLAKKLDEFKDELAADGFGNLDRVLLLRSVLAALDRDIYANDWTDLVVNQEVRDSLSKVFDSAAVGIKRAVSFLRSLGVTSDRLLPYGLQLVLLGEFFRLCPQPSSEMVERLHRWFWVTSFTGWFGSVSSAPVRLALGEIRRLAAGEKVELSVVPLEAPAQPFPKRFDGRSARVRAFLLYLASLRPRSLGGQGNLDPGRELVTRGTKAIGYVCSNQSSLGELFSSPANRMFVDTEPLGQAIDHLVSLPEDILTDLLPSHGFPTSAVSQLRGQRECLIGARLENLIDGEREFMQERNVRLPTHHTAANIADSETSDDD